MNFLDTCILEFDKALRTLAPPKQRPTSRINPANKLQEPILSASEKKHISGLMRVNHSGEVCAQGLYQGQALTASLKRIKQQMQQAADEENDHLGWCEQRLDELDAHTSYINLFWYIHSLLLGAAAGLCGDKVSLGFVAETERQVSAHLHNHLNQLPKHDEKTTAILKQMYDDETEHTTWAIASGGIELPHFVKRLMAITSKVMTHTSYYF